MRRVLVCGGRTYENRRHIWAVLSALTVELPICLIISGGAQGADRIAEGWAAEHHVPLMVFPAHWGRMGRRAGVLRNGWMLTFGRPDLVVAFPGGRGTEDMASRAVSAGVTVIHESPR